MPDFQKELAKQIRKWLAGDFLSDNLALDFSEFEKKFLLAFLQGYVDSAEGNSLSYFEKTLDPFDMPFDEAIKALADKTPTLYKDLDETIKEVGNKVFYIKRATDIEVTKKIYEALQKNLQNGGTLQDFRKDIESVLNKAGMSDNGWYSSLVYRQNMANAYAAGHYKQQKAMEKHFPYWLYNDIRDNRESEICREISGRDDITQDFRIYMSNDPIWDIIYPPNHFNCRSNVIALSKYDMEDYGYKISKSTQSQRDKLAKDLGTFANNPTNLFTKIEKNSKIKEEEVKDLQNNLLASTAKERPISLIKQSTIDRVQLVDFPAIGEITSGFIHEQAKALLYEAMTKNGSKEVAFSISRDREISKVYGTDKEISFDGSMLANCFMVLHNHPRNTGISYLDISFFVGYDNIKIMGTVKNNGKYELLFKGDEFDRNKFFIERDRMGKKYGNLLKQSEEKFIKKVIAHLCKKKVFAFFEN